MRETDQKHRVGNDRKMKKKKKSATPELVETEPKEGTESKAEAISESSPVQIDLSNVDLTNATVLKKTNKNDMVEEETAKKKKNPSKKTVLSLDEFRGNTSVEVLDLCIHFLITYLPLWEKNKKMHHPTCAGMNYAVI